MAVYTKIDSRIISFIENNYNIGKIIKYSGIKKGIENTNYFIKTQKKKYILTIFEKRVSSKDLPFFMNLMSGLSKLKIKCPMPIKNTKGNYLLKIKKKPACLVTFLNGKDKNELTIKDCYVIGKNIAKLHKASKKLKIFRKNSMSINSCGNLLNKIDNKINKLSKNLKLSMKNDLTDIKKQWPKKLPHGIIHCDLFIDNIFFYKKKFYGYIDFYFSCNDFLAYELAICINALCFRKKSRSFIFDKNKSTNLIKGYETIRKLNNNEKKHFNVLCRGSALRYLLTRTYDYLNTPKTAIIKIKDPKEYIQKLNFHRQINSYNNYIK
tara:strand:+ start:905 stop:1873 length:969 start_codon:yes stop_codon:yes gene_type:complete